MLPLPAQVKTNAAGLTPGNEESKYGQSTNEMRRRDPPFDWGFSKSFLPGHVLLIPPIMSHPLLLNPGTHLGSYELVGQSASAEALEAPHTHSASNR
jgi:hypothetical protein